MTAFLPLALSSQDSSFSQEKSTEKGEVAALYLTVRSQASMTLKDVAMDFTPEEWAGSCTEVCDAGELQEPGSAVASSFQA